MGPKGGAGIIFGFEWPGPSRGGPIFADKAEETPSGTDYDRK